MGILIGFLVGIFISPFIFALYEAGAKIIKEAVKNSNSIK